GGVVGRAGARDVADEDGAHRARERAVGGLAEVGQLPYAPDGHRGREVQRLLDADHEQAGVAEADQRRAQLLLPDACGPGAAPAGPAEHHRVERRVLDAERDVHLPARLEVGDEVSRARDGALALQIGRERLVDRCLDEAVLVAEVVVQGGRGDARGLVELAGGRLVVRPLGEQGARRGEEVLSSGSHVYRRYIYDAQTYIADTERSVTPDGHLSGWVTCLARRPERGHHGDMTVTEESFDVVVVGGGPVGENAADRASRTGLSVALVESELVGGECSYWACMPSKVLLRAGAVRALARDTPGLTDPGAPDAAAVFARRDEITSRWDDAGQVSWVEGAGLTLVRGHGRLAGERLVEVTAPKDGPAAGFGAASEGDDAPVTRRLRARHAVSDATGSVPVLPDVRRLAEAAPWSSREATSADAVPESLVVVGGGVVGVEMANAYADLGSQVTLL